MILVVVATIFMAITAVAVVDTLQHTVLLAGHNHPEDKDAEVMVFWELPAVENYTADMAGQMIKIMVERKYPMVMQKQWLVDLEII